MALPFTPMHRKFGTADGKHVTAAVPSLDGWEYMDRNFEEDFREGASLEAGLAGRAMTLRYGENQLRQYHVNESRNKKREKRKHAY